jgi:hypothetical protein
MQELSNSIKKLNLRIMSIEEEEQVKTKVTCNIFNKIITENSPNLEKILSVQIQEASRKVNRPDQNRVFPQHVIIKTTSTGNPERILKALRDKKTKKHTKVNPSKYQQISQWKA